MSKVTNSAMTEHANPLMDEEYHEGNSNAEFINLRAAVSEEILRPRRDTGKTTIDEIRDKVDKIGKEIAKNGGMYNLSVTGHSKAGGLATIVGFYLAACPSLELASAVRVYTFASSPVGGRDFQLAWKYLEGTGRLLHARFTNSNEVGFLPLFDQNGSWEYDDWYKVREMIRCCKHVTILIPALIKCCNPLNSSTSACIFAYTQVVPKY